MNNTGEPTLLAFDVFGTVVDWHSTIAREIALLAPGVDGASFARAWRAGYWPAMRQVERSGEWIPLDVLHRRILEKILPQFELAHLDEPQRRDLNQVWHRLDPWPDSVAALKRLKQRFIITTLSNGNISLLTEMAKHGDLPWDCILSAEVYGHYKPAPQTYLGVCKTFDLHPSSVMLVAAHHDDLDAAQDCGLATAYIERPAENGSDRPKDVGMSERHPLHFASLSAIADYFHC
ncbi:MAG: haloacid dehalogenase type II [Antricoccus sp.]